MNKMPAEQKQDVRQKWEQYQTLPPETRRELATKPVTPPKGQPPPNHVRPAPAPPPPPQLAPGSPPAGGTNQIPVSR